MTKPPRLKTIDKDRRLPKSQFDKYLSHLVAKEPNCQICHSKAIEAHHLLFGAYKDDRTLTTVCRLCHAKKNTEEITQCICTSKSFFVTDHKKLTCRDYICE